MRVPFEPQVDHKKKHGSPLTNRPITNAKCKDVRRTNDGEPNAAATGGSDTGVERKMQPQGATTNTTHDQ